MLIINRRHQKGHSRQRYGGDNIFSNVIKHIANKVTAQKVVDAVVNGGIKGVGEVAAKGTKLAAESALKRVLPQNNNNNNNNKQKTNKKQKIDTVTALINGSGIIYD